MTSYKLNTCTLCIGLGIDITGNCPFKNKCPFHDNNEMLDTEISKFAKFLDQNGYLLNNHLINGQINPNTDLTIQIEIK